QRPSRPSPDVPVERVEPSFEADAAAEAAGETATEAAAGVDDPAEAPPAPTEKIVTLRVVARNRGTFAGDELALTLRGIGMRHGKFGIFHRYEGDDENRIIFSAASLVEPGSFDLANLKDQRIPGVSLFMVLPGPMDGALAYYLMVGAGPALTE